MIVKAMTCAVVVLFATAAAASIVAEWNAAALAEVRAGTLGPPMVARALAIAHTCMYDAWAQYDALAIATTVLRGSLRQPQGERTDINKEKAISFAAYRCLVNLFPGGAPDFINLTAVMNKHGYSLTDTTMPANIGNTAAQAVIDARIGDGSNQYGDLNPGAGPYADYTNYKPRNDPMAFCTPLMSQCAPLNITVQKRWQPLIGPPDRGSVTQKFVGPYWENVTSFALTSADQFDHTTPQPEIVGGSQDYEQNVDEVLQFSAGLNAKTKLNVEYWADGPASEFPAGHWGLFAQLVSQRDANSIDKDAKMFFTMHNASFDAGIVGWHFKHKYDGVRPITAIRYLKQGQLVLAWGGPGHGTESIPGEKWMPYNPGSNLTPAFPGYISGHSVFSSASATVLRLFAGDNFGIPIVIPADFGRVEKGIVPIPAVETTISFPTFSEAARQAGLSRIQGGIHFMDDITVGYDLGVLIGEQAYAKAQTYILGTAQ